MMKVVFIDRDGVINEYPGDADYVKSWEEFRFLPNAKFALKKLSQRGCKIFIISNQAGVSKGIYSKGDLDLITKNMLEELRKDDIDITAVYYCTHKPEDNCSCRKPKTGLIDTAISKLKELGLKIEPSNSYFIGDTIRDIETGKNAGLKTILVFSGKEKPQNQHNWQTLPDFVFPDLSTAVEKEIL